MSNRELAEIIFNLTAEINNSILAIREWQKETEES